MKARNSWVLAIFLFLIACGITTHSDQEGQFVLSVEWPEESNDGFSVQVIPSATTQMDISIEGTGLTSPLHQSLVRSGGSQETTHISLPIGQKVIRVQAFDANRQLLATATAQTTIFSGRQSTAVLELQQVKEQKIAPIVPSQELPQLLTDTSHPLSSPEPPIEKNITKETPLSENKNPELKKEPQPEASTPSTDSLTILSLSKTSGLPGSTLQINGQGFSNIATDNIVLFGTVSATVISASRTQLTVTVPNTSGTMPVSVKTNGQSTNAIDFSIETIVNTSNTPTVNSPPVINSLTANPNPVSGVSYPTEITVSATDSENILTDSSYSWSCDGHCGIFNRIDSPKVIWTAPATAGTYTIRVAVSDGNNSAVEKTIAITVNGGSGSVSVGNN